MSSSTRTPYTGKLEERRDLRGGGAVVFGRFDGVEDAEPLQRDAGLKRDRRERELLRFRDCFERCEVGRTVVSNHLGPQHTITVGQFAAGTRPAFDAERS